MGNLIYLSALSRKIDIIMQEITESEHYFHRLVIDAITDISIRFREKGERGLSEQEIATINHIYKDFKDIQ